MSHLGTSPGSQIPVSHHMKTLSLFTDSAILRSIGYSRCGLLLNPFAAELAAAGLPVPLAEPPTETYFSEIAAILAQTHKLPEKLLTALLTLENSVSPQNVNAMDDTVGRRFPCTSLSPTCAVDRALELHFLAPELLKPFQIVGDEVTSPPRLHRFLNSAKNMVADLGSQTSPPITNHRSLITTHDDAIENQNSKIENSSPDSAVFAHLASLSPAQYDRTRKQSARQLGIRVQTLDAEISRLRKQLVEDEMFQTALATLRSPEPWPEPVDAAELLTRIVERFRHYVILPPGAAEVFTLWSAHAHCFSAFIQSPRLNISSPKPGCGKTTALDVIATLTPRALRTENLTAPVLFRLVHQYQPTLLLDEVDSWLPQAEELRGLLNAGHKRGACAYRCEGEGNAVRPFRAVLAGIGQLTGTLHDRSIVVPLAKAEEGQIRHRFNDERIEIETELCRKLARWTADNLAALKSCDPILPPSAFNRLADNWRPLFAIAQIAGGNWPSLALDSFNHLAAPRSSSIPSALVRTLSPASPINAFPPVSSNGHGSPGNPNHQLSTLQSQLLTDLRQIFTQSGLQQLSSRHLVQALCRLPESPWLEAHNRRPINETWLGRRLRMFDIASRNFRFDSRQARGYQLADFTHAFARFLTTENPHRSRRPPPALPISNFNSPHKPA